MEKKGGGFGFGFGFGLEMGNEKKKRSGDTEGSSLSWRFGF